jgi:hypothetical protein
MLWFLASIARGADVVDAARAALDAAGVSTTDSSITVLPLAGGGTVVRFAPAIDGVPVDQTERVWIDTKGRVHTDAHPLPPHLAATPMSGDAALATARALFGALPEAHARLSWRPSGPMLRLVWTIDARAPIVGYTVPLVRLDAETGVVLAIDEGAVDVDPRGHAYRENPVVEANPTTVWLPEADSALSDSRVTLQQCRDLGDTVTATFGTPEVTLDVHRCTTVPADGPVDGDYFYDPIPYPEDPLRDEDDFAPPHTYFNVHRGFDFFDGLGWTVPSYYDPFLYVTTNVRSPDYWSEETLTDPSAPLAPFDNAYATGGYHDWYGEWIPPMLVFGQGSKADFSYDADVIHHELAHFVVDTQYGPSWSEDGNEGPSVQANALNEGIADYFSCALHGDPSHAEYARIGGSPLVRDLAGDATCMDDLYGEPHYDSLPFSQSLWAYRAALGPTDQPTFDRAVLDALSIMGPNASFASASDILIALADERLGNGRALANAFDARGVRDCRARVPVTPCDEFRSFTEVPGSYEYGSLGPVPGYVQFVVAIPDGGATITVSFEQREFLGLDLSGTNTPQPIGVVGRSGEGIEWTTEVLEKKLDYNGKDAWFYVEAWSSNADAVADSAETRVRASTIDPHYAIHDAQVSWHVETAGPYTFQFVNAYGRHARLEHLSLTFGSPALVAALEDTAVMAMVNPYGTPTCFPQGGCAYGSRRGLPELGWMGALALALSRRAGASASRSTSRSSRPCR